MRAARYPHATWVPTTDYWPDMRGVRYRGIINHVQAGYTATMIRWANQSQANDPARKRCSAHFTVSRDGSVHQYVELGDSAWHAGWKPGKPTPTWPRWSGGNPNRYTVGIEFEGFSIPPRSYSYDYCYGSGVDARGRARSPWPTAAIGAALELYRWLWAEDWIDGPPSDLTITGHYAIDPVDRPHDPGDAWHDEVLPALYAGLSADRGALPATELDAVLGAWTASVRTELDALRSDFDQHIHATNFPRQEPL